MVFIKMVTRKENISQGFGIHDSSLQRGPVKIGVDPYHEKPLATFDFGAIWSSRQHTYAPLSLNLAW
jgi:hypothetical protein